MKCVCLCGVLPTVWPAFLFQSQGFSWIGSPPRCPCTWKKQRYQSLKLKQSMKELIKGTLNSPTHSSHELESSKHSRLMPGWVILRSICMLAGGAKVYFILERTIRPSVLISISGQLTGPALFNHADTPPVLGQHLLIPHTHACMHTHTRSRSRVEQDESLLPTQEALSAREGWTYKSECDGVKGAQRESVHVSCAHACIVDSSMNQLHAGSMTVRIATNSKWSAIKQILSHLYTWCSSKKVIFIHLWGSFCSKPVNFCDSACFETETNDSYKCKVQFSHSRCRKPLQRPYN